jgi:hypothetical protein
VEFKLYLIKEFQRLKAEEGRRLSMEWDLNGTLSKLNYRIHTSAVKANLIPPVVKRLQKLNAAAIRQMRLLAGSADVRRMESAGKASRQLAR